MKALFVFIILAVSQSSFAEQKCGALETPNDLLKCIVNKHATIQVSKLKLEEVTLGIDVASQRPNPELDISAADLNPYGYISEASLLHTFELGGKRSARINLAEGERDLSKASLLSKQEQLSVQTVRDLYRIRQIDHELGVVEEIRSTFQKITKQYLSTGRLSPENKISVSVFKMALEESLLQEGALTNEKQGIIARIEAGLGRKVLISDKLLPKVKKDWPSISLGELSGAQILLAKASLNRANANHELEKAKSWPNLSVGPTILRSSDVQQSTGYGIAVNLPLPLYQRNGGGRAQSLAGVRRSEFALNYTKARLERQKKYFFEVYNRVAKKIKRA